MKRPLYNKPKESCVACSEKRNLEGLENIFVEYSPDWFTYMCIDCMEKQSEMQGIVFDER